MIQYIKYKLYRLKLYKPIALLDKIHIAQHMDIFIYNSYLTNMRIDSIENNIVTYIDVIKKYKNYDLVNEYVPIHTTTNTRATIYSLWYTDSDNNLLDSSVITTWLKEAEIFCNIYNTCKNAIGADTKQYSNSVKLQPYIINIEAILDGMLEH